MKVLLLSALLALLAPQAPSQTTATIEGRVLHAGSQEPIPNVQVTLIKASTGGTTLSAEAMSAMDSLQQLISTNPGLSQATIDSLTTSRETALGLPPGTLGGGSSSVSALTDVAGHFSFKDQAPGRYTVRGVSEGFFGPPMNGSPSTTVTKTVTIEANKAAPTIDLVMSKGGIISGRIRDPNGQPASGVTVGANRVTYSNGRPQWTVVSSKPTDDRGEYRVFWVGPGEYYVGITPRGVGTIPGPQDTWARTFYPGVSDPATATLLSIKDGAEVTAIDFTIQTIASAATFKISGTAINPFAAPNATTGALDRSVSNLVLSPREPGILDSINPPSLQNSIPVNARPNGEFEVRNVRPGSYDLIAYASPPAPPPPLPGTPAPARLPRYYIDRKPVDVRNSDVGGIALEIKKGTEIRGQVVTQGTTSIPMDKLRINLHSRDTIPEAFATIIGAIVVDSSGAFATTDVPGAKLTLQLTGLPDTAYVADIRQAGTSVFDSGLTVGIDPVTQIEIVVNANGETIQGNVQNAEHKPAANATVVLVPPAIHRLNVMMYKTAQSDDTGHFSLKGIPPGEYTLYAWESVPPTAWMNEEFLAKFPNRGHAINATQGTRADIVLDLIPDAIGAR